MTVSATALQVASVLGVLVGQLTVGIPLAMRLNRREHRRRARRATEALAYAAAVIIDEWPDDRAAAMLAAWRANADGGPCFGPGAMPGPGPSLGARCPDRPCNAG